MTTLSCRNLAKDCVDTLSAADSTEIQKVFLVHVHAKHQVHQLFDKKSCAAKGLQKK